MGFELPTPLDKASVKWRCGGIKYYKRWWTIIIIVNTKLHKRYQQRKKRIITNRGVAYPGRQIRLSDPVGSYRKNYRVWSDPIGIRRKLLESLISDSEKILLEFLGSYRILFGSFALDTLVFIFFILNKENFSNILVESNNIN